VTDQNRNKPQPVDGFEITATPKLKWGDIFTRRYNVIERARAAAINALSSLYGKDDFEECKNIEGIYIDREI
jgi:hypothetical protein